LSVRLNEGRDSPKYSTCCMSSQPSPGYAVGKFLVSPSECVCEIPNHHCDLFRIFYCPWHLAIVAISKLTAGGHVTSERLVNQRIGDSTQPGEVVTSNLDLHVERLAEEPLIGTGLTTSANVWRDFSSGTPDPSVG
jgi:hypothetical protein